MRNLLAILGIFLILTLVMSCAPRATPAPMPTPTPTPTLAPTTTLPEPTPAPPEPMPTPPQATPAPTPAATPTPLPLIHPFGQLLPRDTPPRMETPHFLIWTDPDALNADELTQVVELLEKAFDQSTTFLAIQYDVQAKGKIPVLFRSDAGISGFTTSQMSIVFQDYGRFLRVAPGMLMVHEITHIVTGRHEDYLIRHLDAPFCEEKFTSTYAPPGCGFTLHQQAAALLEAKLMVPIDQIPADGLQWGFKAGGIEAAENPQRVHHFYTEAGSFGQYLIERYGVEAMNRLRSRPDRAWTYAYGKPLEALEQEWLNLLEEVRKRAPLLVQRLAAAAQATEPCLASHRLNLGRQ